MDPNLQQAIQQIERDRQILQNQYHFLTYGLIAAWVILAAYVLFMVARERRLRREIQSLKAMVEDRRK